jgi:hypothetical protein
MSTADVDGDGKPELLLAQKNFLRAVVLKSEADPKADTNRSWSFIVKDQINGSANNSRIVGAAAVKNGAASVASLFLLDAERRLDVVRTRHQRRLGGGENIPLPFSDFTEIQPLARQQDP